MAVTFLNNLDLSGNELLNARVQNLASDPGTANTGDIIYNTTSNLFKYYNGSGWVDPSAGSYTSWTLQGDSGSNQTITNGTTVDFAGGIGIGTATTTNTLTINLAEASSTVRGGIELFSDTDQSVAANAVSTTASRTYGIQLNSSGQAVVNVPWADTVGGEFGLAGDGGTAQTIDVGAGDTVTIAGGTGISTAAGATDTVTITNTDITAISLQAASGTNSTVVHDGLIKIAAGTGITTTGDGNGQVTIAATGASTDTTYTLPTSVPAANAAAITLTGSDSSTDPVNFTGKTNQTAISAAVQGSIIIGLADNVTTVGDLTVGGGDITLSGTGRIQGIDTVSAATDAASKTYVDNAVAGGLTVKGGFNASSGVTAVAGTNLYTNTALAVGDYYIVTVAGNFFGNAATPLTVGDSVLVQTAAASGSGDEDDFAVIQSDTDLATISTVGIGNVNIDGAGGKDGLTLAYSSGTATVGLDIGSLPASGAVSTLDAANVLFPVYDDDATANQKITLQQIQQGISSSASASLTAASTVVTHNLGTRDLIIQLYDTVTYDTVYADVSRTSTNTITVIFAATPTNTVKCLIYSTLIQGI